MEKDTHREFGLIIASKHFPLILVADFDSCSIPFCFWTRGIYMGFFFDGYSFGLFDPVTVWTDSTLTYNECIPLVGCRDSCVYISLV